jgi:hypothetical protein
LSQVRELTAKGLDADGKRMHDYNPQYEASKNRQGVVTRLRRERRSRLDSRGVERSSRSLKNLWDTGGLMRGLRIEDDKIVPKPEHEEIAHGQMYHPKWSYHHLFLGIGEKTNKKLELLLGKTIERIR